MSNILLFFTFSRSSTENDDEARADEDNNKSPIQIRKFTELSALNNCATLKERQNVQRKRREPNSKQTLSSRVTTHSISLCGQREAKHSINTHRLSNPPFSALFFSFGCVRRLLFLNTFLFCCGDVVVVVVVVVGGGL